MKPTQEQVIAWARDSGMELYGFAKDRAKFVYYLEAFAALAYEAGRKDENEAALSNDQPYISRSEETAEALRALLAQPEPEPVAWADKYDLDREGHDFWVSRQANVRTGVPLYTAPPQREWQRLMDEEIEKLYLGSFDEGQFARAIEAKLKEKNSA